MRCRCPESRVLRMWHRRVWQVFLVVIICLGLVLNDRFFSVNFLSVTNNQNIPAKILSENLAAIATISQPQILKIRDGDQNSLFQQGLQLYQGGNYRGAIVAWQSVLEQYQRARNTADAAVLAENIGNAYQNLQEYQQAIAMWEVAGSNYQRLRNWSGLGRVILAQAQVWMRMGERLKGIEACNRVLRLAQTYQIPGLEMGARCQLGEIYWLRGNQDRAIRELEASSKLAGQLEDQEAQRQIYRILGNVYTSIALTYYRRVETLSRLGDEREAKEIHDMAIKTDRKAIASFRQVLTLAQQNNLIADQVRALLYLVPPVARNGQLETAQTQLDQAKFLLQILPDSVEKAYLLSKLAVLFLAPEDASLFTSQCGETTVQVQSMQAKSTSVNSTKAMSLLETAAKIGSAFADVRVQSLALGYIGHIRECQRDYENALKYTDKAQHLAKISLIDVNKVNFITNADGDSLYLWQWQLGRIFASLGRLEAAVKAYENAISSLQSLEHNILFSNRDIYRNFRDGIEPVYRELARLHLQRIDGHPKQAQVILDEVIKTIERLQRLAIRNHLATNVEQNLPVNGEISLGSIPQTAVIYSLIYPDQTAIIAHLPNGETIFEWIYVDANTLVKNINYFRRQLENRGQVDYDNHLAQQLYTWILGSFSRKLEQLEIKTVIFAHDGVLRTIPMSALHDGQQFAIEKYAIVNSPILNQHQVNSSISHSRALAMGITKDVIVDGKTLPPLPNIAEEIKHIVEQIPGSKKLVNEEFTRDRLRSELEHNFYPILHIATHAEFNAIADDTFLITGDKTNNKLTISDLEQLLNETTKANQPFDLIALTACGTAIGDERASLGIAGIAIQAGANSALASLWSINDAATTQLVTSFYSHWQHDHLSKAIALQKAQQEMIRSDGAYSHPFYWAPYILVGNGV